MGQEIVYCSKCQTQLRSSDFEKGSARRAGGVAYCGTCARDLPPEPAPEKAEAPASSPRLLPSTTPRRGTEPSKPAPIAFAAAVVGALLVAGLVALSFSGRTSVSPPAPTPVAAEPPPAPAPPAKVVEPPPRVDPIRVEREAALKRRREAYAAEAASLDEKVRPLIEREEFGPAIAAWRESKSAHPEPEWRELADRKAAELRSRAEILLASLKGKGMPASELKARVARWGIPELAVADAPAPAVPGPLAVAPELEAARKSWLAAMEHAAGRDYAAAVQELERTSALAADLERLKALAAVHAEGLQALAKWPTAKILSAEIYDERGRPRRLKGALVKADAGGIELRAENQTWAIPIGELSPGSFEELGRAPPSLLRLFRLIEGQAVIGEDPSLPPKYMEWANRAEPERESQARRLFYTGEREAPFPSTRALAGLKARTLLEDFKDTAFVRRNRGALAARADLGRDYVLLAEDLEAAGTFKRNSGKTGVSWMSESDSDPARQKENFVEAEFSALPSIPYRAWAYVGGCCAETLGFAAQGTDLTADDAWVPVRQSVAVTKTHAGHGGRKQPSRWGWVELPAPEFKSPGTKSLRLLTCQQGFSVATVVVSASRKAPPGDAELRELRKARAARTDEPLLRGLGLWLKADDGLVLSNGVVSEWKDQSGHQRNAVQPAADRRPAPAPGAAFGKPAVAFDGRRTSLELDWAIDGLEGMTIALVSACEEDHPSIWTNAAALYWPESAGWGVTALCPRQSRVVFMFGTGQPNCTVVYPRPAPIGNGYTISLAIKDGAKESLFVNGALVVSQDAKLPKLVGAVPRASIGGGQDNTFFAGRIAEVLVYDRALLDVERKRLQQVLRSKYPAY